MNISEFKYLNKNTNLKHPYQIKRNHKINIPTNAFFSAKSAYRFRNRRPIADPLHLVHQLQLLQSSAHKKGLNQSQLHFPPTKVSIKHVVSKLFKIVYGHASAVMRIDGRETPVAISQRNTALRVSGALN